MTDAEPTSITKIVFVARFTSREGPAYAVGAKSAEEFGLWQRVHPNYDVVASVHETKNSRVREKMAEFREVYNIPKYVEI